MEKRWVLKQKGDTAVVKHLASALAVSDSLANLMVQRNITTSAEADAFFNPSLDYLHDPFLMKDMNIAVDRLSTAIKKMRKYSFMVIMMLTALRQLPSCIHF